MMRDLGRKAFGYGYPAPVLAVGTYNEDGSVDAMNLHECMRTNAGDIAACIGPGKRTHQNLERCGAFTLSLVNRELLAQVDYFGTVSGFQVPEKFVRAGLTAHRSAHVDAPIIDGSPLTIECELIQVVEAPGFTTVLGRVANVAADESVLDERGRVDVSKLGMVLYDPFGANYFELGDKVGKAWGEGKAYL